MSPSEPQFLYIILVLPSLFGLTLVGEGIYKVFHDEFGGGILSLVFGIAFLCLVAVAYIFFSSYIGEQV